MLGGQPSPIGFLGHVIGHTEAVLVYLQKQSWHQLLHLIFLQVMLHRSTQHLLLYPPMGFSKGYHLSYWSIDDVTLLPAKAPPPPGELTNHGLSCPDAVLRMCYVSEWITPFFISLPAFERRTSPDY